MMLSSTYHFYIDSIYYQCAQSVLANSVKNLRETSYQLHLLRYAPCKKSSKSSVVRQQQLWFRCDQRDDDDGLDPCAEDVIMTLPLSQSQSYESQFISLWTHCPLSKAPCLMDHTHIAR